MLRVILIALAVLYTLRWLARLTAPRAPGAPATATAGREPKPRKPSLDAVQRAELEAERERALREGRQLDAIKLHRKLAAQEPASARDPGDAARGRER